MQTHIEPIPSLCWIVGSSHSLSLLRGRWALRSVSSKQFVPTRWNSSFLMYEQWMVDQETASLTTALCSFKPERKKGEKASKAVQKDYFAFLRSLIEVLAPFEEATTLLLIKWKLRDIILMMYTKSLNAPSCVTTACQCEWLTRQHKTLNPINKLKNVAYISYHCTNIVAKPNN